MQQAKYKFKYSSRDEHCQTDLFYCDRGAMFFPCILNGGSVNSQEHRF